MSILNPHTGKQIKILRTEASIWKEHKTLSFTPSSVHYDTIYTEGTPSFLLLLKTVTVNQIQEASKRSVLIFLPKVAPNLHLKNVVSLQDITKMYPHMGDPWDGTVEDAVTLVAILLGHKRIFGSWNARAASYGLSKAPEPFRLWWICVGVGDEILNSKLIDKIVPIKELFNSEKHPTTYADIIRMAASFPPDVVVGFSSGNVRIDDKSWRTLWDVNLENKFLALFCYNSPSSTKGEHTNLCADIQDAWVLRVKDILDRGSELIAKGVDIPFGQEGASSAVALEMLRNRFTVVNPALSMKTWKYNVKSPSNNYVDRPVYHYIHPTGIHDLYPMITIPKSLIVNSFQPADILRPLEGSGKTLWLSAFNKQATTETEPLKLSHTNPFTPFEEHVLFLRNCFQTSGGLAFDKDTMYIGKCAVSQALWAEATMSVMTPTISSDKSIIVPWPEGADTSREVFVLQYLSKVLRIMPQDEIWEFFCPEKKEVVEAMECFRWNTAHLPVIKHEKELVVWCKEAYVALPTRVSLHSEDVIVLRNRLRGWKSDICTTGRLRIVIVEDEHVLDDSFVRNLEDVLEKAFEVRIVYARNTTIHRITYVMAGAWGVICSGSIEACAWNWILPHGAFVFEVLGVNVGDTCLGISSVAGLHHRFCERKEENIFEEVWKE